MRAAYEPGPRIGRQLKVLGSDPPLATAIIRRIVSAGSPETEDSSRVGFFGRDSPLLWASGAGSGAFFPQRIDDLEKGEAVKIGVPCDDTADAVFAHQYCRMEVMHLVAAQVGRLFQGVSQHRGMAFSRSKHSQTRRSMQGVDESLRGGGGPGSSENA